MGTGWIIGLVKSLISNYTNAWFDAYFDATLFDTNYRITFLRAFCVLFVTSLHDNPQCSEEITFKFV